MSQTLEPVQLFGGPMDGARVPWEWVKNGGFVHGITAVPATYSQLIKQEWAWAKHPDRVMYRVAYKLENEELRYLSTAKA